MKSKSFSGFYFAKEIHSSDKKEHNRLVGHNVYISKIIQLRWHKTGKLFLPVGNLEKVCKLDIGRTVMGLEKGKPIFEEEILDGHKKYSFPDGSYIIGKHIRKKLCDPYKEKLFRRYLDLSFNIQKNNGFDYNFSVKKDIFDSANPLVFCIETYVIIDDVLLPSPEFELIKPLFEQNSGEMKFKSLRKWKRKTMYLEVESLFA